GAVLIVQVRGKMREAIFREEADRLVKQEGNTSLSFEAHSDISGVLMLWLEVPGCPRPGHKECRPDAEVRLQSAMRELFGSKQRNPQPKHIEADAHHGQ